MANKSMWHMVEDERTDFVDLARGLTPSQWEEQSLCQDWTVRDVIIHAGWDGGWADLVTLARCRFSVHRMNAEVIVRNRARSTDSLTDALANLDFSSVQSKLLGARNCLRAITIHQQDIRRPLGLGRTIPEERLRAVLDVITKRSGSVNLGSHERADGLHLAATDIGWKRGSGPEVRGPAEAIIMAISGREAAVPDLRGDGLAILTARV